MVWGVYIVIMDKPNSPVKLYVGSGTNAQYGVLRRLANYRNLDYQVLPRLVLESLQDDYDISHISLLCWAPIPDVGLVPRFRVRMVVAEAVFTFLFFAGPETKLDPLYNFCIASQ